MIEPEEILSWLRETGHPLELRVGKRFQVAGWHVNYNRWFRDATTDKQRPIDVQTIVGAVRPGEASIFYSLCVECKTSRNPWVGIGSGTPLGENGSLDFAVGALSRLTLVGAVAERIVPPCVVPDDTPRVGGVLQALAKKNEGDPSAPYAALRQARSGALAIDREYKHTASQLYPRLSTTSVVVPIVALDGQLFEYSVESDLKDKLREVDALVASVPGDGESPDALVPVVTERYAERISAEFFRGAHNFCIGLLPHASVLAGTLRALEISDPEGTLPIAQ
jgi:hypothetical protein